MLLTLYQSNLTLAAGTYSISGSSAGVTGANATAKGRISAIGDTAGLAIAAGNVRGIVKGIGQSLSATVNAGSVKGSAKYSGGISSTAIAQAVVKGSARYSGSVTSSTNAQSALKGFARSTAFVTSTTATGANIKGRGGVYGNINGYSAQTGTLTEAGSISKIAGNLYASAILQASLKGSAKAIGATQSNTNLSNQLAAYGYISGSILSASQSNAAISYSVEATRLKYWNGSEWVSGELKAWDGYEWIGTLKKWNNTAWI